MLGSSLGPLFSRAGVCLNILFGNTYHVDDNDLFTFSFGTDFLCKHTHTHQNKLGPRVLGLLCVQGSIYSLTHSLITGRHTHNTQ